MCHDHLSNYSSTDTGSLIANHVDIVLTYEML